MPETPSRDLSAPPRHSAALFATGLVLAMLVLGETLGVNGAGREGWQLAARYTARVSALLFLLPYVVSALGVLAPLRPLRLLRRERRGLGFAFAGAHAVHFIAIVGCVRSGMLLNPAALALGSMAYALLAAMVLTSSGAARRRLGERRWRALHAAGIHYLWFTFAFTYIGALASGRGMAAQALLLVLYLAALAVRVAAWRRRRARRPAFSARTSRAGPRR